MEQSIKGMMGWYMAKMKVPCTQIFKLRVEPHLFNIKDSDKYFSDIRVHLEQEKKMYRDEVLYNLFRALEKQLTLN